LCKKQSQLRKECLTLLQRKHVDELPPPAIFQLILLRDDRAYRILEGDKKEVIENKEEAKGWFEFLLDFYVDRMLPAIAGVKMWGPDIRSQEEVSKSTFDGTNRITASTEAFTVLVYMNCWKKWNAMHRDFENHRNSDEEGGWKCPRFNKKHPDVNPEYETPYTDSASGQRRCGGYTCGGMKRFFELQKMVVENRRTHAKRIAIVDQACIQRLRKKRKVTPKKGVEDSTKKKDGEADFFDNDEIFDIVAL